MLSEGVTLESPGAGLAGDVTVLFGEGMAKIKRCIACGTRAPIDARDGRGMLVAIEGVYGRVMEI